MPINYPERFSERVENLMANLKNLAAAKCVGNYNRLFNEFPHMVREAITTAMEPWDTELKWMEEDRDAWAKRSTS